MNKQPEYIFETSWEVCNRVGGIYAVLSTRAASMQKEHPDKVFFFGPDFGAHSDLYFKEDKKLLYTWTAAINKQLPVRVGRWMVPGEPIAILLKADNLWAQKDQIYAWAWEKFGVRSHAAYGDYDESSLFGYAAGQVMESLYHYLLKPTGKNGQTADDLTPNVVAHANEWQTAFAIFYVRDHCPRIGTLFTTHATGIGRSIAGNGKPLYDYFEGYHGDQMADELNMVSKHSVEKMAAHWADCFTTVSDITARECAQLLDKPVDIVTPNGFEPDFVPRAKAFITARASARAALLATAEKLLDTRLEDNCLMLCIAGRLEWKNKGIDVFFQAMERLGEKLYHTHMTSMQTATYARSNVLAFAMVPYLDKPVMRIGRVTVICIPFYLNGKNNMDAQSPVARYLNGKTYYNLLIGMDLTLFPSYYEPWGYTPLESIAFHVPTITTDVAGFGAWALQQGTTGLKDGVAVIHRTDSNFDYVVDEVAQHIVRFMQQPDENIVMARKAAAALAKKAEWTNFFKYYRKAYDIALKKAAGRTEKK